MKNEQSHINEDKLIAYIAGEGSEMERKAIERWITTSADNKKLYDGLLKTFRLEYGQATFNNNAQNANFNVDSAWNKVAKQSGISTNDKQGKIISINEGEGRTKNKSRLSWLQIAAAMLIGASLIYYFVGGPATDPIVISFDQGIHEHYLPDSSKVVFEGKSSISYNPLFNIDNRTLSLSGKAYFDVERNTTLPFVINTANGQISVLGTAFLVEEKESQLIVQVERGKVSLASSDSSTSNIILERNEIGILDIQNNSLNKTLTSTSNNLYWANKRLTYRQKGLAEVLTELSDLFQKQIVFDSTEISHCRITAVYNNQAFTDIIENLSLSLQFDYNISGDTVEIISNGCQAN